MSYRFSAGFTRRDFLRLAALSAGGLCGVGAISVLREALTSSPFDVDAFISSQMDATDVRGYVLSHFDGPRPAVSVTGAAGVTPPSTIVDTHKLFRVTYSFVDENLVPADMTFDELYADYEFGMQASIAQVSGFSTLFDVGDDEYYVALVGAGALNNLSAKATYISFTRDNVFGEVLEECRYDFDTGLAYVPKSLLADDKNTLWVQCLLRIPSDASPCASVPVNVTSTIDGVPSLGETACECRGWNPQIRFPVVSSSDAQSISDSDIFLKFSGIDAIVPIAVFGGYDASRGEVWLNMHPATMCGIEVVLARPAEPSVSGIVLPRVALADGTVGQTSSSLRRWPYGGVRQSPALKANVRFKYRGCATAITVQNEDVDANPILKECTGARQQYDKYLKYAYSVDEDDHVDYDTSSWPDIAALLCELYGWPLGTDGSHPLHTWADLVQYGTGAQMAYFSHMLLLPGSEKASDFVNVNGADPSILSQDFWSTIHGYDDTNPNRYVASIGGCSHAEATVSENSHFYIGDIWARVLEVNENPAGEDPYIIMAFHTPGFGVRNADTGTWGQASQVVIKFDYVLSGYMEVVKNFSE